MRPFVWILSAGRPAAVLSALGAIPAPGWPPGVHFAPGALQGAGGERLDGLGGLLRLGIVVASELPRERSTILVRLMAGGQVLKGALEDLSALPPGAHEHAVASRILLALRRALESKPNRTTEEEELIVDFWKRGEKLVDQEIDKAVKKAVKEARKEALDEGHLEQARSALRRVLAVRGLATSPDDEARIEACTTLATLERWHDQALTASSVTEALRVTTRRTAVSPARRASAPARLNR